MRSGVMGSKKENSIKNVNKYVNTMKEMNISDSAESKWRIIYKCDRMFKIRDKCMIEEERTSIKEVPEKTWPINYYSY